jgi:hypothetical protein
MRYLPAAPHHRIFPRVPAFCSGTCNLLQDVTNAEVLHFHIVVHAEVRTLSQQPLPK